MLVSRPTNVDGGEKRLFRKLDRSMCDDRKILPDELMSYQDEAASNNVSNKPSKASKLLQGLKSKKSSKMNQYDDLTPNDFMQLLDEDKSITNEFCYLTKATHAYDLRIVDFPSDPRASLSCPDQYITISKAGVTYFGTDESRHVPLDQWKRE